MPVELFSNSNPSVPRRWRFRFRAPDGGVTAVSTQAYPTKQDALDAAIRTFGLGRALGSDEEVRSR